MATVRRWGLELEPPDFASGRSFAEILGILYGEFARRDGRRRWGDKTPHYVADIPILARIFPRARILHIYRDGRDVALSWVDRRFGPRNLFSAAAAWRGLVGAGRRDGPPLRDRYKEVRYETLLENPEQTMRAVCDFLEEPFVEDVLKPAERTYMYAWRQIEAGAFRPRTEVERDNGGKWRARMSKADRALFESTAGDLMVELGYPTEGLARSLPARRRAWWTVDNAVRTALDKRKFRELSLRNFLALQHAGLRRRLGRPFTLDSSR